ncbi:MAG: substrate-binding domain-containing protein, partial [Spirochaetales bacterium]|nr:substrate-binding domain-containing protein [Spirochaetales bacterium]
LLREFEKKTGISVDVLSVGTGKAITLGERGDADLLLVHAKSLEEQFIAQGYGVNRREIMSNDFVILGPREDPAGIRGMHNTDNALKAIAKTGAAFVSRGDESGTYVREKQLWQDAGLTPSGAWYREVGQGMAAAITMADDMQAYTLADRGTFIALQNSVNLELLVEGDSRLYNQYAVIAVNPAVHPQVEYAKAMRLIDFLTSAAGQKMIGNYKINGQQLYLQTRFESAQQK